MSNTYIIHKMVGLGMKEYRVWEAYGGGLYVITRRSREKHVESMGRSVDNSLWYSGLVFKRWVSDWVKYERVP